MTDNSVGLGKYLLGSKDKTYNVSVSINKDNTVNVYFGSSFMLKLDYDSSKNLENILQSAVRLIENRSLDEIKNKVDSEEQLSIEFDEFKNYPINW